MKTKEDIFNIIEEEDIEFIRLQFTDIKGNLKNIAVTPGQLDRAISHSCRFSGSAIFDNCADFPEELCLHPILDSFVVLPWRPQQGKVARLVCEVCTEDGKPFPLCPRKILGSVLEKAAESGYSFWVDPECEFFLFHTDEFGLPTTITHERAGYMDVGPTDFGENARRDIVLMLEEMGFDVESSLHEASPAQHEIRFKEQEAMQLADSLQTFRFAVRSVAKQFGLYATFMPKPRADCAGSGMHLSFALVKDGKNLFRSSDGSPSETALSFIGGLLTHAPALTAIGDQTVNSYKRLLSDSDAPDRVNWSSKGEKSFVKLVHNSDDTKVELRFPDGSANPYLIIAAAIAAGIDGIEKRMNPGEDCRDASECPHVPLTLKDAVLGLEADEVITDALGKEFTSVYAGIKKSEWRDYMTSVSDWELDRYLSRL